VQYCYDGNIKISLSNFATRCYHELRLCFSAFIWQKNGHNSATIKAGEKEIADIKLLAFLCV
jgi:hypothetical protein